MKDSYARTPLRRGESLIPANCSNRSTTAADPLGDWAFERKGCDSTLPEPFRRCADRSTAPATGETVAATTFGRVPDERSRTVTPTDLPAIDTEWLGAAACADLPIDAAFPGPGGQAAPELVAACDRCPVRAECLRHALARPVTAGYLAATTPAQRRRMR